MTDIKKRRVEYLGVPHYYYLLLFNLVFLLLLLLITLITFTTFLIVYQLSTDYTINKSLFITTDGFYIL